MSSTLDPHILIPGAWMKLWLKARIYGVLSRKLAACFSPVHISPMPNPCLVSPSRRDRMWMAGEVFRPLSLPRRSRRGLLPSHRQVVPFPDDICARLFSLASDLRFDRRDVDYGRARCCRPIFTDHACAAEKSSVQSETFKVMERRPLRAIINPAMIATWILARSKRLSAT